MATPDDALKTFARTRDRCPLSGRLTLSGDHAEHGLEPCEVNDRQRGRDRRCASSRCATDMAGGWRSSSATTHRDGICPYYAGSCAYHCDIGAGEGAAFDLATNRRRLAWFARLLSSDSSIRSSHLVIYNSGSVLNPRRDAAGPSRRDRHALPDRCRPFASFRSIRARPTSEREVFDTILDVAGERIAVQTDSGQSSHRMIGFATKSSGKRCHARPSSVSSATWARWRPNLDRTASDST